MDERIDETQEIRGIEADDTGKEGLAKEEAAKREGAGGSGDDSPKKKDRWVKPKFFGIGFVVGVFALLVTIWLGAFGMLAAFLAPQSDGEPTVTTAFITGKLEEASELTTAKYLYSSVQDYEEGFIPIINKSRFAMFYTSTVRAGINVSDIGEPEITEEAVILTLPASTIQDVHIDSGSLRFFDQEKGLITTNEREQVAIAMQKAEEKIREVDMSELLDLADEQLEKVMRGLFEDSIGDKKLIINHAARIDATAGNAEVVVDE